MRIIQKDKNRNGSTQSKIEYNREKGSTKPIDGFCLGDQGEFFGCKKFNETIKVILLAEFTKMV